VHVIDFDDCGDSWYLYDLAASLSFIEHEPYVPELVDAWVAGYREVAPLSAEEEAELPTFVLLRRLLLVAWIGSHAETETARGLGAGYTAGSCDLAEQYLSRQH
jgi:Ser/Thr protein kinase RdoA (MazF antagonist)